MASNRITMWALTIHESDIIVNRRKNYEFNVLYFNQLKKELNLANTYEEELKATLQDNFGISDTEIYFAFHDKDGSENHYHVVIKFKYNKGRTFEGMKKCFPNSHLEVINDWKYSVKYLIHDTPNSKEKYQYDKSIIQIVAVDKLEEYWKLEKEEFDWEKIEEYILIDCMPLSMIWWGRRFGYNTIVNKWKTILDIYKELRNESNNIFEGEIIDNDNN